MTGIKICGKIYSVQGQREEKIAFLFKRKLVWVTIWGLDKGKGSQDRRSPSGPLCAKEEVKSREYEAASELHKRACVRQPRVIVGGRPSDSHCKLDRCQRLRPKVFTSSTHGPPIDFFFCHQLFLHILNSLFIEEFPSCLVFILIMFHLAS